MRRKDREMNTDFALSVTDSCPYGVMSMTDDEGNPYCIPLSIVRKGMSIYFHCADEGFKTDCLKKRPQVCIACCTDVVPAEDKFTTYYKSAVIRGTACEVTDDKEKTEALYLICQKYTPKNMPDFQNSISRSLSRTAVWRVDITSITGKQKKSPSERSTNE